jgi:hypothetical protein
MLYDSTKGLLRSILQSLETPGNVGWDDHVESVRQCLYEMHQMARPEYKGYRTEGPNGKPTGPVPVSIKVTKAIPHVKVMVGAIRRRDQAAARESCKAALAEM